MIPTLSGDELAAAQAELEALQTAQAARAAPGELRDGVARPDDGGAEVVPAPPGRIERALERAADVLAAETVAVVYAAVVAAPFILLGARARDRRPGGPQPLGQAPARLLAPTGLWMNWHTIGTTQCQALGPVLTETRPGAARGC